MLMHFHVGDSNRAAPGMGHTFHTDSYVKHHDTSYLYLKYPEFSIQYLKEIEEKL